jgi:hypothetical protein
MRRIILISTIVGALGASAAFAGGITFGPQRPYKETPPAASRVDGELLIQQLKEAAPRDSSLARPL